MGVVLDAPWVGQQFSPPTPIDIATIETAIVTRLQSMVTSIEIVHFPDNPKNYRLTHRIGAALVVYRGSDYGPVRGHRGRSSRNEKWSSTSPCSSATWDGAVGGPPGATSPGAYAILEAIRAALTGYRVPGARKIYMVREKFVERDTQGGVWIYLLTIALRTMAVAALDSAATSRSSSRAWLWKPAARARSRSARRSSPSTRRIRFNFPKETSYALTVSTLGGSAFIAGTDFTLDPVNGIVTRIASGGIAERSLSQYRMELCRCGGSFGRRDRADRITVVALIRNSNPKFETVKQCQQASYMESK